MRELTLSEQCEIAGSLAELARSRYDRGDPRDVAVRFSNSDIGKAIPREWYSEDIHLNREAKATIRAEARRQFGRYKQHGGPRKGAGRKALPKGEKRVNQSVTMSQEAWEKLDRLRGDVPRGRFLEQKIQSMRQSRKQ